METRYCTICGKLINIKAEYCPGCGCRPLAGNNYCDECGKKLEDGEKKCTRCGGIIIYEEKPKKNSRTEEIENTQAVGFCLVYIIVFISVVAFLISLGPVGWVILIILLVRTGNSK